MKFRRSKKQGKKQKKERRLRYQKVTRKRRGALAFSATILLIAVLTACCGVLTADHNSRVIGWGEYRTELAFSVKPHMLGITFVGNTYRFQTGGLEDCAGTICGGLRRALAVVSPPPMRLSDMLIRLISQNRDNISDFLRKSADKLAGD